MSDPVKIEVPAGTFGFSFIMRPNGSGGTFPKTYSVASIANRLLTGFVSEFSPVLFPFWPSDPGDNIFPTFARDYGPANGGVVADGLCPNNVRLSQVPLSSLVASYGIGPSTAQRNLPTSTNYNNPNFNTTPGAVNTLGDFGGLKKVALQVENPAVVAPLCLVNGGFVLGLFIGDRIEIECSNLGAITVVNLNATEITVGVTAEMNL